MAEEWVGDWLMGVDDAVLAAKNFLWRSNWQGVSYMGAAIILSLGYCGRVPHKKVAMIKKLIVNKKLGQIFGKTNVP